jgi:hypothetical protein
LACRCLKIRFSDHFFCGTGSRVSVLYDPINDFWLKQCLKEKIGKFMERKERNAEGKTSACQITTILRRNRNFYPKSSLLSSFSATENEHLLFGFSTKIVSEKYSSECVKFYTPWFCYPICPVNVFFLIDGQITSRYLHIFL